MAKYGYARVSSTSQSLDEQLAQLRATGCNVIRSEKISGTSTEGREELRNLLTFLRAGDELWITRIDRLARSVQDLANIVADLKAKGVILRATQQPIDNSTPAGAAFLNMLGVFAQFETELRKERQMEGISRAKAKGVYNKPTGRKQTVPVDKIRELRAQGLMPTAIAKQLSISRPSVYRALEQ